MRHHISFRLGGWLDCSIIKNIVISWHLFRCIKALATLASRNIWKRAALIETTKFAHHERRQLNFKNGSSTVVDIDISRYNLHSLCN